jgi:hypothetical protein
MKFESGFDNKGHGYEAERPERLLSTNSPDEPWQREQVSTPGTAQDVWKRYIESRLRTFGSRGN